MIDYCLIPLKLLSFPIKID